MQLSECVRGASCDFFSTGPAIHAAPKQGANIMTTNSATISNDVKPAARALDVSIVNAPELRFGSFIDKVIKGQPNANKAARRAFRRTLSKLRTGTQPYYVIVAPGPTTSGKSELGFRFGEFFHGNRLAVLNIDGSEYMEKHNLSKLTGASPNLVGYTNRKDRDYVAPLADEVDGYAQLSQHNLTRSRLGSKTPVTVVLIDEWEKACKEFNEILLSIFRTGRYTLGNGEVVDFSQCLFIITANIGSAAVEEAGEKRGIGFRNGGEKTIVTVEEADKIINDHLRHFAPPEFRARVEENGEFCIFHRLSDEHIAEICELKVAELVASTEKMGKITIDVDADARKWLLETTGSVPKLNGGIKTYIIDMLDNELLKGTIVAGDVVHIFHVEGADHLDFTVDVKPLVFLSMAEMEAEIAATPVPAPKGKGAVVASITQKNVGAPTEGNGEAKADTTNGAAAPALVSMQPFDMVYGSDSAENLEKITASIRAAIEKTPHSLALKVDLCLVEPFVANIEVMSTLDGMRAIKARYTGLRVILKGGELA